MKFGVFDHIDEGGLAVGQQFEERLALIERYEQAGFHAYHLAEHHGTPLGHGPSPSVFIAAATQRTTTLRLGPLVYCLPLYHPLRLIEEVCMLDHLSDGRLQLGVGAGVSPIEVGFFEVDWDSRRERFDETFEILLEGLASDELTHHGPEHHYDAVPMTLRPVQQPHPPLWFGISHTGRAEWVAEHEVNVVALLPAGMVRPITDAYRAAWAARGRAPEDIPFMGVSRLIVVAETDDEAMSVARRAYRRWFHSINLLWRKYDVPSPSTASCPRTSPTGTPPARASPARRPRRSSTSPPRSRRRGSTTSARTSSSATSPSKRRRARSSSSRARSSPRSTRWRRSSGAERRGAPARSRGARVKGHGAHEGPRPIRAGASVRGVRLLDGARDGPVTAALELLAQGDQPPDVARGRGLRHLDLALDALHLEAEALALDRRLGVAHPAGGHGERGDERGQLVVALRERRAAAGQLRQHVGGRAAGQGARELSVEVHLGQRRAPGDRRRQALGQERALGATGGIQRRLRRRRRGPPPRSPRRAPPRGGAPRPGPATQPARPAAAPA